MSDSSSHARWIVVPPFRNDLAWRTAASEAAVQAGFRVYDFDVDPGNAPINDPQAVILTADGQSAISAGAVDDALGLIISGSGIRALDASIPSGTYPHVASITDLMARTGLVAPHRIFRFTDFASKPLDVLEGVRVHAPPLLMADSTASDHLTALDEAVGLLDPARPAAKWRPAVFTYDSRTVPGGTWGELDLTGRPRFLISGPYITLPPGRWRATYRLIFDQPGSRPRFRLDWGTQTEYLSEEFVPGRAGEYEIVHDYVWTERAPCELRILLREGVFDGQMTFKGAEITRAEE